MTPKDYLTNKNFCPMPWTGLMYNFDGDVKNCIRSSAAIGNISENSIEEILNGKLNLDAQQNILANQPVQSCSPCRELEKNKTGFDIISDRVFYMRELKTVPMQTYQHGNHDLHTIDVRWSNLCNFACVYCTPSFSTKWQQELKVHIPVPAESQLEQFKSYIFSNVRQLKHVYLAGGEPLLMKQNLELLELLKKENPEVHIRINTNLSKVDTKIFEKICEFKNVHWTVSVETMQQEFEYVRFGGTWTDFLENLQIIRQLDHKISFNMLHFLLNYLSVFDCVDFLQGIGFHSNSFIIGPLLQPEYLNIRHLPSSVLQSVESKLQDRINSHPGFLLEESYQNMLAYIQQPFDKNLQQSLTRLSQLDQRRNIDSRSIFTEFYKLT